MRARDPYSNRENKEAPTTKHSKYVTKQLASVSKSFSESVKFKRHKMWYKNQNDPSYANIEPETGKTLRLLEGITLR